MNKVVSTSMTVRLTVMAVWKEEFLKKFVVCPITLRIIVGKNTVRKVARILRPSVI